MCTDSTAVLTVLIFGVFEIIEIIIMSSENKIILKCLKYV